MLSKFLNGIGAIVVASVISEGYGAEVPTEESNIVESSLSNLSEESNLKSILKAMGEDAVFKKGQKLFFDVSPMEMLSWCSTGESSQKRDQQAYPYRYVERPSFANHPETQKQIPLNSYFIWPDGQEDFLKTAEEIYQEALDICSVNLDKGHRVFSEKSKDYLLHNLAFAAQRGHAQAQLDFAIQIYLSPYSVTKCYSLMHLGREEDTFPIAYHFFKLAADQGNKDALCCLGQIFYQDQSYDKAYAFFTAAAQQKVPEAYYMLGELYRHGNHVSVDFTLADSYQAIAKGMGFEA